MSAIINGQISLHCNLNKIIKEPGTSFQSPVLSQKHVRNVFHTTVVKFQYFNYVAMFMMMSQTSKTADFTKAQKFRYLENKTLFLLQIKKIINCASRTTLWQKIVL